MTIETYCYANLLSELWKCFMYPDSLSPGNDKCHNASAHVTHMGTSSEKS